MTDPQRVIPYPGHTCEMANKPHDEMRDHVGRGLLDGRRAVITGGDSGTGRAVGVAFAKEGADIAITYLHRNDDAKHTASLAEQVARRCVLLPADLADPERCASVVERTANSLGTLDILANNLAYQNPTENFTDISDEQWRRTFAVNIDSFFRVTKTALDHVPDCRTIVNTGSINGLRRNKTLMDAQRVESFGGHTPFGRAARPDEIAPSYLFFAAGELSSYYSCEVLAPVGGETLPG
jgi:NAD(P)-dependent dehydrogenase (short-subunit alcohol dehydrogenase family)